MEQASKVTVTEMHAPGNLRRREGRTVFTVNDTDAFIYAEEGFFTAFHFLPADRGSKRSAQKSEAQIFPGALYRGGEQRIPRFFLPEGTERAHRLFRQSHGGKMNCRRTMTQKRQDEPPRLSREPGEQKQRMKFQNPVMPPFPFGDTHGVERPGADEDEITRRGGKSDALHLDGKGSVQKMQKFHRRVGMEGDGAGRRQMLNEKFTTAIFHFLIFPFYENLGHAHTSYHRFVILYDRFIIADSKAKCYNKFEFF